MALPDHKNAPPALLIENQERGRHQSEMLGYQILQARPAALDLLDQFRSRDEASISVMTRTEVLASMRPREDQITIELLLALLSLPVTETIADRAGRLIYTLARNGVQLSFPDALIAATALEHNLILVTTNARHFPVAGLKIQEFPEA